MELPKPHSRLIPLREDNQKPPMVTLYTVTRGFVKGYPFPRVVLVFDADPQVTVALAVPGDLGETKDWEK